LIVRQPHLWSPEDAPNDYDATLLGEAGEIWRLKIIDIWLGVDRHVTASPYRSLLQGDGSVVQVSQGIPLCSGAQCFLALGFLTRRGWAMHALSGRSGDAERSYQQQTVKAFHRVAPWLITCRGDHRINRVSQRTTAVTVTGVMFLCVIPHGTRRKVLLPIVRWRRSVRRTRMRREGTTPGVRGVARLDRVGRLGRSFGLAVPRDVGLIHDGPAVMVIKTEGMPELVGVDGRSRRSV
jgi:hypothetical protein